MRRTKSSYEDIGQWVYDRATQLKESGLRWGLAVAMARREFNEQQDPEVYDLPE